jgi:hypothetical protein
VQSEKYKRNKEFRGQDAPADLKRSVFLTRCIDIRPTNKGPLDCFGLVEKLAEKVAEKNPM